MIVKPPLNLRTTLSTGTPPNTDPYSYMSGDVSLRAVVLANWFDRCFSGSAFPLFLTTARAVVRDSRSELPLYIYIYQRTRTRTRTPENISAAPHREHLTASQPTMHMHTVPLSQIRGRRGWMLDSLFFFCFFYSKTDVSIDNMLLCETQITFCSI